MYVIKKDIYPVKIYCMPFQSNFLNEKNFQNLQFLFGVLLLYIPCSLQVLFTFSDRANGTSAPNLVAFSPNLHI